MRRTDSQGNYKFTGISPGAWLQRLSKPSPPVTSVLAQTQAKVNGSPRGSVVNADVVGDIDLLGGEDSVQNISPKHARIPSRQRVP